MEREKQPARAKARKAVVLALPFVLTLVLPLALVAATFHLGAVTK